uniref:asparagine synthetase domain-containing protein 1-like isoform X2 n=1 Tax=Myxine glutinosa TaxID=7769 RepID=UPI003590053F
MTKSEEVMDKSTTQKELSEKIHVHVVLCDELSSMKAHMKVYKQQVNSNVFFLTDKAQTLSECKSDSEGLDADNKGTLGSFEVPDRLTARSGLQALQALCPGRQWILVEINISRAELVDERRRRITHLVYPADTVLDDSIGCALWFAARGQGTCRGDKVQGGGCSYTSTARVLLSGVGADEQLAGYSRHRQRFATSGWPGLARELQMELDRISQRNLGRDDRIVSDHGKEARFPYLDEDVVTFLSSLPIWLKVDLRLPRGIGDKLLLRLAAHWLGLTNASTLPKRAMQFGSRIARLEGSRERGSDCCHRLQKP